MKVQLKRVVDKIEVSANEWQLYGHYPDKGWYRKDPMYKSEAHRDRIAASLNREAVKVANKCDTHEQFVEKMERITWLPKYGKYGAGDTEGRCMVWTIANQIYGKKEGW